MKLNKNNWNKVKLGNVCEQIKTINSRTQKGFFNYIDIGSIDSFKKRVSEIQKINWINASVRARQIVKKGDSLFSTVRVNLERIAFLDKNIPDCIASTGFTVVRANEKAYSEFLFYVISSPNFIDKTSKLQKGTAYPAVTDRIVFDEFIPLPPLEEQKQIAALFQSIDASMERVEEQERNIIKLKKQLLIELFGDKRQFGTILNENDYVKIQFDKLADNISERVEPKETDLDIYVGLEHLDPDDLKITRTGSPDEVIGTKLKIYKGDIIFGKRRAYQRKVAVSHFDGIASAHSMILRANEKNIEKDFLPYFMQSDAFMNRAIQISEGSLSPTIKWKTLAQQEFIIPAKKKQIVLIDLFKSFDSVINKLKDHKNTLRNLKTLLLNDILG